MAFFIHSTDLKKLNDNHRNGVEAKGQREVGLRRLAGGFRGHCCKSSHLQDEGNPLVAAQGTLIMGKR